LAAALLGGVLIFLAFPPANLWPLAWVAPVPWLLLVRRERLAGRRPYVALYLAGFLHWMALLWWLTLPHWATSLGWVALSFYLGFYLPVFVGLARVAVHRLRCPLTVAAPVVWTGLELARAHLLSGFTMASLGHTQQSWLAAIQIADLGGAYAVSFLVMAVAACAAEVWGVMRMRAGNGGGALKSRTGNPPLAPPWKGGEYGAGARVALNLLWAIVLLVSALGYGYWLLAGAPRAAENPVVARVALIQGCYDTTFDYNPNRSQEIYDEYMNLTRRALAQAPDVDLIVWPETMYGYPLVTLDEDWAANQTDVESGGPPIEELREYERLSRQDIARTAEQFVATPPGPPGPYWLLGIDVRHFAGPEPERFNSALWIDPLGAIQGRYDKMHLVMFGEYVPLGATFPWIYGLTPLGGGLSVGTEPACFELVPRAVARGQWPEAGEEAGEEKEDAGDQRPEAGGQNTVRKNICLSPSICYESTVPHLIRRQMRTLEADGRTPDVLVNLTNDGWFWGSSELDMHLTAGVFRAVETRRPMLIAANTGFSASIDGDGHILARGPRHAEGFLVADVRLDGRTSPYLAYGDLPAGLCLAACALLGIVGLTRRRAGQAEAAEGVKA
jgi:apolipoprotein N-acyltransferase